MSISFDPSLSSFAPLSVRYSFLVAFLPTEVEHLLYPLDIRFQKVSGLSAKTEVQTIHQGGDNNSMYSLPLKTTYDNLILEKGRTRSTLNFSIAINDMFFFYTIKPINILITAVNPKGTALSAWMVLDANPVRWSVSDLDANSNEVIIDTLEFTYRDLKSINI